MMRVIFLSAALLVCAHPAAAQRKTHGHCSGKPIDSAATAYADVYRDCEVDNPVTLRERPRPSVRIDDFISNRCYRAEFEFVVDTTGVPEFVTVKMVKTNSRMLADSTMAVLMQTRYEPAKLNGKTVRQLTQYTQVFQAVKVSVKAGASVTNAADVARGGRTCS